MRAVTDKLAYLKEAADLLKSIIEDGGETIPENVPLRERVMLHQGNLTELSEEIDRLLSEVNESLDGMTIAEKIVFAQTCKSSILEAISNKGVEVQDVQPLSTIHGLIDKIESGSGGGIVMNAIGYTIQAATGSTIATEIIMSASGSLVE